jgi:hypothetical protein
MEFYYKLITKQDISRSFVVNKNAISHFFEKSLTLHGDEEIVFIRYKEPFYEETKLVLHQDARILLKNRDFCEGDIAFFKKVKLNYFDLFIFNDKISVEKIKGKLNDSNFYLSNTPIAL